MAFFFFTGWGLPLYIACVSSNVYLSLLSSVATGRTTMLDKKSNFKFLIVLALLFVFFLLLARIFFCLLAVKLQMRFLLSVEGTHIYYL